jgi:hypothetical protein
MCRIVDFVRRAIPLNRDHVILIALALPLLLLGIQWGLPRTVSPETIDTWGYDEIGPISPLAEAYHGFTRSQVNYLAYPLFHYIVLTAAGTPYLVFQVLTGSFHPAGTFPFGMSDPMSMCWHLALIYRLVTVCMALGVVLCVYTTARLLFDRLAALWAGCLTALMPLFVYYGKTANLDIPYTFWLMLAVFFLARILVRGDKTRDYVLFGVCAALAVCTKDQAIGYLAIYPFLLAGIGWRDAAGRPTAARLRLAVLRRPLLLGLLASVLTFVLANNLVFGWAGFLRHLSIATEMSARERMFASTPSGQLQLAVHSAKLLLWSIGPLVLWGLLGGACLLRRNRWAILGLLAAPLFAHQVLILGRIGYAYPRFFLPGCLFTILLGSSAVHIIRIRGMQRTMSLVGVAGAIYCLVLSTSLDYALLNDARYHAESWIRHNAPRGSGFKSYARFERVLPRVWDNQHVVLTRAADPLEDHSPDMVYIMLAVPFDAVQAGNPEHGAYFDRLLSGQTGYQVVAEFDTPTWLPRSMVMLSNGLAPRITILQRKNGKSPASLADSRGH